MRFTGIQTFMNFVSVLVGVGFAPTNFSVQGIYSDFKQKGLIISHLVAYISPNIDNGLVINFYNAFGKIELSYNLARS